MPAVNYKNHTYREQLGPVDDPETFDRMARSVRCHTEDMGCHNVEVYRDYRGMWHLEAIKKVKVSR